MKLSKIKSIKKIQLNNKIPVYDIEVKKNHNFILNNGLVVHNCIPYQTLKSAIYEERLLLYEAPLLTEELIGLERNNNGKIDHGPSGINSKDQADAVCGALYNASQHAEEFAFEFGEDLSLAVEVSGQISNDVRLKQQITLDFEQELQRAFENQNQKQYREELVKRDNEYFRDFGAGKAQVLNPYYLSQGIIL